MHNQVPYREYKEETIYNKDENKNKPLKHFQS